MRHRAGFIVMEDEVELLVSVVEDRWSVGGLWFSCGALGTEGGEFGLVSFRSILAEI